MEQESVAEILSLIDKASCQRHKIRIDVDQVVDCLQVGQRGIEEVKLDQAEVNRINVPHTLAFFCKTEVEFGGSLVCLGDLNNLLSLLKQVEGDLQVALERKLKLVSCLLTDQLSGLRILNVALDLSSVKQRPAKGEIGVGSIRVSTHRSLLGRVVGADYGLGGVIQQVSHGALHGCASGGRTKVCRHPIQTPGIAKIYIE